ncbi:MAG: type II toxin-antitoxin system VapC family toxin [Chthonomonas sp.]|nr:type II toxin-antitoxin system VapC family toxin [Chthonomonas sp.]
MATYLVDSNILLDVISESQEWFEWSSRVLEDAADQGRIVVNPVIYSEVSVRFSRIEMLDDALDSVLVEREAIPWEAAFLAGKCFQKYRRRGGTKVLPLPDFFIGAHAAVAGYTILTRDSMRYKTYFPTLPIVAP